MLDWHVYVLCWARQCGIRIFWFVVFSGASVRLDQHVYIRRAWSILCLAYFVPGSVSNVAPACLCRVGASGNSKFICSFSAKYIALVLFGSLP